MSQIKEWLVRGWQGRLPLWRVFWWGAAAWFAAYFIVSGLGYSTVYAVRTGFFEGFGDPGAQGLFVTRAASKWIALGLFIWWSVSVWKCAKAEPDSGRALMARGLVVLLAAGNMLNVLI